MTRVIKIIDYGKDYGFGRYVVETITDGEHDRTCNLTNPQDALTVAVEFLSEDKPERNEAVHPAMREMVNNIGEMVRDIGGVK